MELPKNISFEAIPSNFEFPLWHKVTFTCLSVLIVGIGLTVHRRVWTFLQNQNGRPVDRIIKLHTRANYLFSPLALGLLNALGWASRLKDWISPTGCYIAHYLSFFHPYYLQCHSFTIAIFRYVCIVHPYKVKQLGPNGPWKLAMICNMVEIAMAMVVSFFAWLPTTPETQSTVLNCLGRNEVFFDFDFFTPGGHDRKKAYCQLEDDFARYACTGVLFIGLMIASNLLEIGLNYSLFKEINNQTDSVASMMSKTAFLKRKRDDRIVMTVTIWQWLFELGLTIFISGLLMFMGSNRIMDHFLLLFGVFLQFVILPAFFLLYDIRFRRALDERGLVKAFFQAIQQSY